MRIPLHALAAPGLMLVAVAALAALSAALPGDPAAAGAFTVTKQADTADGTCDSDCSLREAIIAANASPGADVITLPAGDYHLDITGADEDAAATGDLDITDDLTVNGAGAASTIVDGMGDDRVFEVFAGPSSLSGITISGGNAGGGGGGGGLRNAHTSLTISESIVTSNTASYAGGIENIGGAASLILTDSAVLGNTTRSNAGGIFNNTGTMTVLGSTISGNTAVDGEVGGIDNSGGSLTITNSTISGNTSTGVNAIGGGIKSHPTLHLDHVTITGNSAASGDGGGIVQFGGTVSLENTIVAGNTGENGDSDCTGTLTSEGHNLIENLPAGCTIAGDTTGNVLGQDPLLGPLANNGGPTQTHALQSGSPAIDAAANDGCPGTDQRGFSRPFDGDGDNDAVCDIGAFEYGSSPPTPSPTPTPTGGPHEVVWGDNRCNGGVDATDALAVLRSVAQLGPLSQTEPCPDIGVTVQIDGFADGKWADVNCDGNVTSVDALADLRNVAALPPLAQHEPCPDVGTEVSVTG